MFVGGRKVSVVISHILFDGALKCGGSGAFDGAGKNISSHNCLTVS